MKGENAFFPSLDDTGKLLDEGPDFDDEPIAILGAGGKGGNDRLGSVRDGLYSFICARRSGKFQQREKQQR